jgi:hypothetical protein
VRGFWPHRLLGSDALPALPLGFETDASYDSHAVFYTTIERAFGFDTVIRFANAYSSGIFSWLTEIPAE